MSCGMVGGKLLQDGNGPFDRRLSLGELLLHREAMPQSCEITAKTQLILGHLGLVPSEFLPDLHGPLMRRRGARPIVEPIGLQVPESDEDRRQRLLVGVDLGVFPRQPSAMSRAWRIAASASLTRT